VKFLIGTASTDKYVFLTLVARMRDRLCGQALVIRRMKVRKFTRLKFYTCAAGLSAVT
jgi:hypothetical protein